MSRRRLAMLRALELVARVALRVWPPRDAKRVVDRLARRLTSTSRLDDPDEARRAADALDGPPARGTCLSRALAVGACLAESEVVIGVRQDEAAPRGVRAHAWVEVRGAPLRPHDPEGEAIARLA